MELCGRFPDEARSDAPAPGRTVSFLGGAVQAKRPRPGSHLPQEATPPLPAGSGRCVEAALSLNGQTVFKNSAWRVTVSSDDLFMRAETQADIDAIKQSLGLLRRHL